MPSCVPHHPSSSSSHHGIGHKHVVVVVVLAWTHGCLCRRRAGMVMRVTSLLSCWHGYMGALVIVMLEWIRRYPPRAGMDTWVPLSLSCWSGYADTLLVLAWTCRHPHQHAGVDMWVSSSLMCWHGHAGALVIIMLVWMHGCPPPCHPGVDTQLSMCELKWVRCG